MTDPLLVTLRLDAESQERLDALRRRHFPPGRSAVGAHVMLFHALPDTPAVATDVSEVTTATAAFGVEVAGPRSLGRGVALTLVAPPLLALRAELARRWDADLTRQDRQRYAPHVTVQNKVDPATAQRTLEVVRSGFTPWTADAVGLDVWVYRSGPWEPRGSALFG